MSTDHVGSLEVNELPDPLRQASRRRSRMAESPMRVLVLGGYGAVGAHLVRELDAVGMLPIAAGRDPRRADRQVDLGDPAAVRAAASDVDIVVNAAGVEDAELALSATEAGAAFVDITATTSYVSDLELLRPQRPVIVNVGLTPGLTSLLAVDLAARRPEAIDLVVLLGGGERHGAAAMDWTYALLGRSFPHAVDGSVRNFSRSKVFDLPRHGRRRALRVDISDQHALTRTLGLPVRTYLCMDSRLATGLLATLTWLPGASRLPRGLSLPGSDRWLALARASDGRARWAEGRGQSRATAAMTALAVRSAAAAPAGVHHLHDLIALTDLPASAAITVSSAH